jgi:hypothetical protein
LTGVEGVDGRKRDALGGGIEIGVSEDDVQRLPAELGRRCERVGRRSLDEEAVLATPSW